MSFFKRTPTDAELVEGIRAGGTSRRVCENRLYELYKYLIREGTFKHQLTTDESATAYADAVLSVIEHIVSNRFEGRSKIKTYLTQIFFNKCVDLIRKNSTNRESVHHSVSLDDLVIPDEARTAIQSMISEGEIALLRKRLQETGEKCHQIIMAWGEGYTDEEIARTMQYQTAAVAKTSRLRCLERLRSLYKSS